MHLALNQSEKIKTMKPIRSKLTRRFFRFSLLVLLIGSQGCTQPDAEEDDLTTILFSEGATETWLREVCEPDRYLNLVEIFFDVGVPDVSEMTSFKFHLEVAVPGSKCALGIPLNTLATTGTGDTLPSFATNVEAADQGDNMLLTLDLTIEADRAVDGGISLVVESIDPLSSMQPQILNVNDWQICSGDDCATPEAVQSELPRGGDPLPTPTPPSCIDCASEEVEMTIGCAN